MLRTLKEAGTIGILADQNTMREEGVSWIFSRASLHDHRYRARGASHRGRGCAGIRVWDDR